MEIYLLKMDAISGLSESLFSKSKQTRQQAGIFLTFITLVVVRLCNFALLCVTFIAFCFCVSQDWIWVALAGLCSAALQRCVPIHSMGCTNRGGWRRKKEKGSGMKNKRKKKGQSTTDALLETRNKQKDETKETIVKTKTKASTQLFVL